MSTIDFHSLAKTELHCHLDGSLSLPTIRQLAAMANIDLPASDEELKHHVTAPATVRISWTIWRPLTTFGSFFKPKKP